MGKILPWIVMIVIISGIIIYANPNLVGDVKEKVIQNKDIMSEKAQSNPRVITIIENKDDLISGCIKSFNECKSIATRKYDISISLLEIEEFDNKEEAQEFYNTWKGFFDLYSPTDEGYPLVLLALTIQGPQTKMPLVVACNKEVGLIQSSERQLLCG